MTPSASTAEVAPGFPVQPSSIADRAPRQTPRVREPLLRVVEAVGALSLITDLGLGQPLEHALRSSVIAVRFGRALGLSDRDLSDAFFVTLLRFVGCTAAAHEMAEVLGDEIAARGWLTPVFTGRLDEMPDAVRRNVGVGEPPSRREQLIGEVMQGLLRLHGTGAAQCEVAQLLAQRLGLGPSVIAALGQVFERWDGMGVPRGIPGEEILVAVQVAQIAQNAEMFWRQGGVESAVDVLRSRAGSAHDPRLVEQFCADAAGNLAGLADAEVWELALAVEPGHHLLLEGVQIDLAATAFADFADLKSPFTVGHSRGVARLAATAARACGLPDADAVAIERAALVHDIGRAGVPARLWEKPGPLTPTEWERVRLHSYYTDRALARAGVLAKVGAIASHHHERLDGTGYHRGSTAAQIPFGARLVAAADAFHAMTEHRAHRPALSIDYAVDELRRAVRDGKLDGEAAQAILAVVGQSRGARRLARVGGLTERELEVVRLLARGMSDRQIAERLTVSARTAHHHVEHIYTKLGVSTRAAATVVALQHDLVGDPLELEA
jgi:HD-GYP domain-containing protein (c-di-GMP phosphodiesterase class II)